MVPGGATEAIWHFAGYLHITEGYERARLDYRDDALRPRSEDYGQRSRPDPATRDDLPDIDSKPVGDFAFPSPAPAIGGALTLDRTAPVQAPASPFQPIALERGSAPSPGGTAGYGVSRSSEANPEPWQKLMDARQLNTLLDDDRFGSESELAAVPRIDTAEALSSLLAAADAELPSWLRPALDGSSAPLDWARGHDPRLEDGASPTPYAQPGTYLDGERLTGPAPDIGAPRATTLPDLVRGGDTGHTGQAAELGSSHSTNRAVVLDANESSGSMIVLGDYFRSQAIIQANVYSDNDSIDIEGLSQAPREITTSGNAAHNIAQLIQSGLGSLSSGRDAGSPWRVDVVDGDFVDVASLHQVNWLTDNDVTVQTNRLSYSQVVTGDNRQVNFAGLAEELETYDLIIIGGSFHQANVIRQTNVVLDDDRIVLDIGTGAAGGPQTIVAGDNWMLNSASIRTFGAEGSQPLAADLASFAAALRDGGGSNPDVWWSYSGVGSAVMDVLYITGHYWDLNIISQVNVVSDADVAVQSLVGHAPGETRSLQFASTGGNVIENFASIVDVGSVTTPSVGGDFYDDAILIQASIVNDHDVVIERDVATLVPELIAFTDLEALDQAVPIQATLAMAHDNFLGSVMG